MEFKDKVAVVTGGAKGIGEATARAFAREGATVAILDVDDSARSVGSQIKGIFIRCDVSKARDVEAAFTTIVQDLGGVDYLVNNAGIQRYSNVTETTEEEW